MIERVYWYLFSSDVPGMVEFYTKALGFDLKARFPDEREPSWAWLERDAAAILIEAAEEGLAGANRCGAALYLDVADADALYTEFTGRGFTIAEPPADTPNATREFELRDPDGNRLIVGSRIEK